MHVHITEACGSCVRTGKETIVFLVFAIVITATRSLPTLDNQDKKSFKTNWIAVFLKLSDTTCFHMTISVVRCGIHWVKLGNTV